MGKKFILITLLTIFYHIPVFAQSILNQQELDMIEKQKDKFFIAHVKVGLDNVFLNKINYIQTSLSPFFKIENFYLSLDFPLRINAQNGGIINSWDYIYPNNYLNFVQMVGYMLPDKSLEVKISPIVDLSIGDGLLMSGFRNDLFMPIIRQLALTAKGKWKYIGFDFFTANIENFSFGGFQLFTTPLIGLKTNSILKESKLYGAFIYDTDTKHIFMLQDDKINLRRSKNSEKRYTYTTGIQLPFYSQHDLKLSTTIEHAGIISDRQYAVQGKFTLQYSSYTLDLGLAYLKNGFHMNFFSPLYIQPDIRENRPKFLSKKHSMGYELSNKLSFFNNSFNFYLDFYGQIDPLFSYRVSMELKPSVFGQLSLLFSYIAEDISSWSSFIWKKEKVTNFLVTKVAYNFADNTEIGFFYRHGMRINKDNENLQTSNEISVKVSIFF